MIFEGLSRGGLLQEVHMSQDHSEAVSDVLPTHSDYSERENFRASMFLRGRTLVHIFLQLFSWSTTNTNILSLTTLQRQGM